MNVSPAAEVQQVQTAAPSRTSVYLRNTSMGLLRILVNALVAIVLPALLTHRLPVSTYGAWVLVLQLGAYVSYLDVGVQTGVSKYIAEYFQKNDMYGCSMAATSGFRLLVATGGVGLCALPVLAWSIPRLFPLIPQSLQLDVRVGVLLVGGSLIINLVCSVFSAIFLGLQRYQVPSFISMLNRVLYGLVISAVVFLHGSMMIMGIAVAVINVGTALLQVMAWRRWAPWISINASIRGHGMMRRMLEYCGILALWSAGMLCVSGLDLTIVGHYAFADTAYYALAAAPANLIILLLSAGLGPLLPATSALSVEHSARKMGDLLVRVTRYSALFLVLTGLPLIVWGGPVLRLWVGASYAQHSLPLLRILIAANIVRNLLGPYATFVIATGRQRVATISAMSEATVNLVSSIVLAKHFGAFGVAYGTLLGAFVGVGVHLALSMHYTYNSISVTRTLFFLQGLLRPLLLAIPSVLLLVQSAGTGRVSLTLSILAAMVTLWLAWQFCLQPQERTAIAQRLQRLLRAPEERPC